MPENEKKKATETAAPGNGVADPATEEAPLAGVEAGAVEDKLSKVLADCEELRQTLVRRQADFDNYRKRVERERSEDSRRATARVIEGLIPVLDGFEHALAAHKEAAYEEYRKGFELIYKQLLENLARLGVERHDPTGKAFDPHVHQAVDRVESAEHEDGTVCEVYQPGYVFHGRVLRPALVRVAVHPAGHARSRESKHVH